LSTARGRRIKGLAWLGAVLLFGCAVGGCGDESIPDGPPSFVTGLAGKMPTKPLLRSQVHECSCFDTTAAAFTFVGSCTARLESKGWMPRTAVIRLESGMTGHVSYRVEGHDTIDVDVEPDASRNTARIPVRNGSGTLVLTGMNGPGMGPCVFRLVDR
jgi:hypothetical protein